MRTGIVEAHDHLGDTHAASGDLDAARKSWQRALEEFDDPAHPTAVALATKITSGE